MVKHYAGLTVVALLLLLLIKVGFSVAVKGSLACSFRLVIKGKPHQRKVDDVAEQQILVERTQVEVFVPSGFKDAARLVVVLFLNQLLHDIPVIFLFFLHALLLLLLI